MSPKNNRKLSSLFYYNSLALRFFGLYPKGDCYTKCYKFYRYLLLCFAATGTILKIYNFRYIYNDLMLASSTLYVVLSEINQIVKSSFTMHNYRIIKIMLKQLEQEQFQPQTDQEHKKMDSFVKFWKLLAISFLFDGSLTLLLWSIYPLIDNSKDEQHLPFVSWFPYDYRKTPYYQLTYIYQLLAVYYFALSQMAIDISVAFILTITRGQCCLLSMRLESIYEITEDKLLKSGHILKDSTGSEARICSEMEATFRELIVYHNEILEFAKMGNKFIGPVASIQLVTTVLVICATMFQMTLVTPFSSEFWSQIAYQIGLTFQILLYCWFADQVLTESQKIPYAIFKSKWLETTNNFKRDMLFFVHRAQIPIKFKAMDFFTLSLPTFSSVIRTSWSYFAVLRTVQQSN